MEPSGDSSEAGRGVNDRALRSLLLRSRRGGVPLPTLPADPKEGVPVTVPGASSETQWGLELLRWGHTCHAGVFGVSSVFHKVDLHPDADMLHDKSIAAIVSQYEGALDMLRSAIVLAPEGIWDSPEHENRTWRLAYHALWGVRFYLGSSPEVFVPWEGAIEGAESLGGSWEPEGAARVDRVHTAEELTGFLESLLKDLPAAVASLPLDAPSGFEWYPFSRLELHINTIRHTQHHAAQIIERARGQDVCGFGWVAGRGISDS